jgi:hypothetical protein
MYFAYTDDSRCKHNGVTWQIMASVLVKDSEFRALEALMSVTTYNLVPPEKQGLFTEFKASEVYGGHGLYEGIPEFSRYAAISGVLSLLSGIGVAVVYGALNLDYLKKVNYASANPFDVVFRICARGVEHWMSGQLEQQYQQFLVDGAPDQHHFDDKALFIVDESGENKALLQKTFRQMRRSYGQPGELEYAFDDMYFGDSRFSVGIQLADACAYFIGRHVSGDAEAEEFYSLIEPHIVYSEIEPKKS